MNWGPQDPADAYGTAKLDFFKKIFHLGKYGEIVHKKKRGGGAKLNMSNSPVTSHNLYCFSRNTDHSVASEHC